MPLVELAAVEKTYGRNRVLRINHLTLNAGEKIQLIGTNGSGKSTLLRLIVGVSMPTRGEIRRSRAFRSMRIGYLPQTGGVYPNLSVLANLRLRLRLYDKDLTPHLLSDAGVIEEFGLHDVLDRMAGTLSGGYQRLVALAGTLLASPEALFLDEPFAGIDGDHSDLLRNHLAHNAGEGRLVVVTDHAPDERLGSVRVIRLQAGQPA